MAAFSYSVAFETGAKLGLLFRISDSQAIEVANFFRPEGSDWISPAEACGKIALGDVLTGLNSIHFESYHIEEQLAVLGVLQNPEAVLGQPVVLHFLRRPQANALARYQVRREGKQLGGGTGGGAAAGGGGGEGAAPAAPAPRAGGKGGKKAAAAAAAAAAAGDEYGDDDGTGGGDAGGAAAEPAPKKRAGGGGRGAGARAAAAAAAASAPEAAAAAGEYDDDAGADGVDFTGGQQPSPGGYVEPDDGAPLEDAGAGGDDDGDWRRGRGGGRGKRGRGGRAAGGRKSAKAAAAAGSAATAAATAASNYAATAAGGRLSREPVVDATGAVVEPPDWVNEADEDILRAYIEALRVNMPTRIARGSLFAPPPSPVPVSASAMASSGSEGEGGPAPSTALPPPPALVPTSGSASSSSSGGVDGEGAAASSSASSSSTSSSSSPTAGNQQPVSRSELSRRIGINPSNYISWAAGRLRLRPATTQLLRTWAWLRVNDKATDGA
jgi:hypothetical protein